MATISGFKVTVGLGSLEVQVIFGSVGLSQDWRQISAPVGSCWTSSKLKQVTRRLNETCDDNIGDLRVISTSKVVMAEKNASCAFKGLLGN